MRIAKGVSYTMPFIKWQRQMEKSTHKRVDRLVLEDVKRVIHILVKADEDMLISNATEKKLARATEKITVLTKEKVELGGNVKHLWAEMIQASKIYGIEATTNLQLIIADALSRLDMLKEQLIKEKMVSENEKTFATDTK